MKIGHKTILLLLTCLMILDIPYLSQTINNILTLLCEMIVLLEVLYLDKSARSLSNNKAMLLYFFVLIGCTLLNEGISTRVMTAVVTGMQYVLLFASVNVLVKKSSTRNVINSIWKLYTFILIIVDICIFITEGRGLGGNDILPYYLIGNKFTVSYLHMFVLGMFLSKGEFVKNIRRRRFINIFLTLYSALICLIIECNTGFVGCVVIGVLIILIRKNNRIYKLFISPVFYILFFSGLTFLLVGTRVLIDNAIFQNIIYDVFNRDITWTGRIEMFELTLKAFYKKPWFGYGINSTYISQILGWGNAQNGILKMLLDSGVLGTVSFFCVVYSTFKEISNHEYMINFFSMIAFLYGMAVCSTVEINISGLFFFGLAIIYNAKKNRKNGD